MLAALLAAVSLQPIEPNRENYQRWLTFIQPDAKEQAYKEIPWRNHFWTAVTEAKELQRPILLWTMNGHPLGCT